MKTLALLLAPAMLVAACTQSSNETAETAAPAGTFFERISALCGKNFEGSLVTEDPADADFAGERLVARAGECSDDEVRIAFDVGENRTRTWIITRTEDGLRLKHRHMLDDGAEDLVSQYGGDTTAPGTESRQEFPADAYSKEMFTREGMTVSLPNVWAFEIEPDETLVYELARPGRLFRVRFDLSNPV